MYSFNKNNNFQQRNSFYYSSSSLDRSSWGRMNQCALPCNDSRWSEAKPDRKSLYSSYNSASNYSTAESEVNVQMRRESYSFPVINLSTEALKEAFYMPKKRMGPKKTCNFSNEQEASPTLHRTAESSTTNSPSAMLLAEDASNDVHDCPQRKDSLANTQCSTMNVNDYTFQENPLMRDDTAKRFSHNYNRKPKCDNVPPFSPIINTNENTTSAEADFNIKRNSSMKNPFHQAAPLLPYAASQPIPPLSNLENTEILSVNVKVSENETLLFKLNRFDDLFNTVKLFCEINRIDEKFIKPLILQSLKALNQVYQAMNYALTNGDKMRLELIEKHYVNTSSVNA